MAVNAITTETLLDAFEDLLSIAAEREDLYAVSESFGISQDTYLKTNAAAATMLDGLLKANWPSIQLTDRRTALATAFGLGCLTALQAMREEN